MSHIALKCLDINCSRIVMRQQEQVDPIDLTVWSGPEKGILSSKSIARSVRRCSAVPDSRIWKILPRFLTVGTAVLTCNLQTLQDIQRISKYVERYTLYILVKRIQENLQDIQHIYLAIWKDVRIDYRCSHMQPAETTCYTAHIWVGGTIVFAYWYDG